jgi:serine protease inhibitor
MKRIMIPSLVVMTLLAFAGCSKEESIVKREIVPITLTNNQKALVLSNNAFGFDIFRKINDNERADNNVFISPLSISLALAMTCNGASGETLTEMQNTLRFPDLSGDEVNEYFHSLSNALLNLDPTVNIGIANSIWYRQGFSVLPAFIKVNKDYYNAEAQSLDFDSPASVNTINHWVASKTNDKITKVIDAIDPYQVMLLINAIYFKGQWTYNFDKNATADGVFHLFSTGESAIPFMHQQGTFNYYSNDSLQMVEMPYGQGNFSMIVLLPAGGYAVSTLANCLSPEMWNEWTDNLRQTNVKLSLPKFKFQYERELNNDLIDLGMRKPFSIIDADFTKINAEEDLYISLVKHNSFVEVSEEGTEAAAVTTVAISTTSIGPEEPTFIPFIADRPFVFVIRETTTNTLIFMGKIVKL